MKPTTDLAVILKDIDKFQTYTKSQAEIVITQYKEDLAWTKGLEHLTTIYDKTKLPNYGYGLETMLRHIITRYDSLADVTMFCQGNIADRADQPMYPLTWYFDQTTTKDLKAVLTDSYDPPKSQFRMRITDPQTFSSYTLREWREKVLGIPYRYLVEMWVRGDWIAVGRDRIRSKPLAYYCYLYDACKFGRGLLVEECWFLERSWWAILTYKLDPKFTYPSKSQDVLLQ
jgi:hypothetical protein